MLKMWKQHPFARPLPRCHTSMPRKQRRMLSQIPALAQSTRSHGGLGDSQGSSCRPNSPSCSGWAHKGLWELSWPLLTSTAPPHGHDKALLPLHQHFFVQNVLCALQTVRLHPGEVGDGASSASRRHGLHKQGLPYVRVSLSQPGQNSPLLFYHS